MRWPWRKRDEELDEEIRAHIEMSAREREERGAAADEARAAARREFGNVELVKETTRDTWSWVWLERVWQDVRYGLRMMRRSPGFTIVAVLTLALGIGANTAIFSLVDAVMLRMVPVQHPEQLAQVMIAGKAQRDPSGYGNNLTNPIWEEFRNRQDIFSGAFAWSRRQFDLAQGGEAHYADGLYVSGDFFRTLGVNPAAGRVLTTADDFRGCPATAMLSYGYWRSNYGGELGVIGSEITLDDRPFQIVGVAGPGFTGVEVGRKFDVAIPLCAEAVLFTAGSNLDRREAWWLWIMGRLKSGVSQAQANARLASLSPAIFAATVPQDWKPEDQNRYAQDRLTSQPGATGISSLRNTYDEPLRALMMVVGLVLLIACANIASLLMARATARREEMAVRLAIGASRWQLVRQLLTECILLSSLGALLGILFARWGQALLVRLISTSRENFLLGFEIDWKILAFTAGVAVLTGIVFGVAPAILSTRISLTSAMKGGPGEETEHRSRLRPERWIVAGQVALSLVLLTTAGLFLRSFAKLMTLDLGFDRAGVLIMNFNAHDTHMTPPQLFAAYDEIAARLRALPGVTSVSESEVTPIGGNQWDTGIHSNVPGAPNGRAAFAMTNFVSPGFFATLRTPLLAGRDFTNADTTDSQSVAVINQALAAKFFPGTDPVGKYLAVDNVMPAPPTQTLIVGIAKNAKYSTVEGAVPPTAYFPYVQLRGTPPEHGAFELRTAGAPAAMEHAAADSVGGVNATISLQFTVLEQQVSDSLTPERLLATLSGFFGALALLLAMIGLYGVLSYIVTQRKREIGVRMAIGAGRAEIVRLVLRDVGIVLLAGCVTGVTIAEFAARFLTKMLYGIEPYDVTTIAIAIGLLVAAGLVAGYLPARHAARLDPMTVLREE